MCNPHILVVIVAATLVFGLMVAFVFPKGEKRGESNTDGG